MNDELQVYLLGLVTRLYEKNIFSMYEYCIVAIKLSKSLTIFEFKTFLILPSVHG